MRLTALLALLGGAAIGLFLPDVDRTFPFLLHRSILTHGVCIPLLSYLSVRQTSQDWKRTAVIGLSLTVAIHLAFDLFPQRWWGFALIQVPLLGSLSMTVSILWLLGSLIGCLYLALRLILTHTELTLALSVSLISFLIAARSEQVFWSALLLLLFAAVIASCMPNRLIQGRVLLRAAWQRLRRERVTVGS